MQTLARLSPLPVVSVGMSFYNNSSTLSEAIGSILFQTYEDWELILINDGSTDDSFAIAKQFTDPRIRLLDDCVNRGFVSRLNQLVTLARGQYFARMDADDLMHPSRLELQVAHFELYPDHDLVDADMYSIDQSGSISSKRSRTSFPLTLCDVLHGRTPFHATIMGRIEWFRRFPYDPFYVRAEDLELWARSVSTSRFGHLEEFLYFVREGKVNVVNYVRSQLTSIQIFRRYGPATLGWPVTFFLCVRARLKALAYRGFGMLHSQHLLVACRNTSLTRIERSQAETALARARGASV